MSRGRILRRAAFAAFIAALLAGPGAAFAPSTMRWAAWVACPAGTAPMTDEYAAAHRADETDGRFWCVAPDGVARDRTMAAIGGLWLLYFMGTAVLLSIFAMRGAAQDGAKPRPAPAPPRPVAGNVEAEARALLANEQKIQAIRIVREATGMGLKEAKDWVEALPSRAPGTAFAASPAALPGPVERLADLKQMLDTGLITPEDYEAKKSEILAGL